MTNRKLALAAALALVGLLLAALGLFGRASIAVGGGFLLCLGFVGGCYYARREAKIASFEIEPGRMLWER
jgi:hypothetical protein